MDHLSHLKQLDQSSRDRGRVHRHVELIAKNHCIEAQTGIVAGLQPAGEGAEVGDLPEPGDDLVRKTFALPGATARRLFLAAVQHFY